MIRLRNCRRRRKQRSVIERLASKLWVPKLWLPMSPGYPCCCEECLLCEQCTGCMPNEMQVTLGGTITGQTCTDGECGAWLDDWVLPPLGNCWDGWGVNNPVDCIPLGTELDCYWREVGSEFILNVAIAVGLGYAIWKHNYGGSKPTCDEPNNRSLTQTLETATDCDFSLVTCNVTAL